MVWIAAGRRKIQSGKLHEEPGQGALPDHNRPADHSVAAEDVLRLDLQRALPTRKGASIGPHRRLGGDRYGSDTLAEPAAISGD